MPSKIFTRPSQITTPITNSRQSQTTMHDAQSWQRLKKLWGEETRMMYDLYVNDPLCTYRKTLGLLGLSILSTLTVEVATLYLNTSLAHKMPTGPAFSKGGGEVILSLLRLGPKILQTQTTHQTIENVRTADIESNQNDVGDIQKIMQSSPYCHPFSLLYPYFLLAVILWDKYRDIPPVPLTCLLIATTGLSYQHAGKEDHHLSKIKLHLTKNSLDDKSKAILHTVINFEEKIKTAVQKHGSFIIFSILQTFCHGSDFSSSVMISVAVGCGIAFLSLLMSYQFNCSFNKNSQPNPCPGTNIQRPARTTLA